MKITRIYTDKEGKLHKSVCGKPLNYWIETLPEIGPFYLEINFDDKYIIIKTIEEDGERVVDFERFETLHILKMKL